MIRRPDGETPILRPQPAGPMAALIAIMVFLCVLVAATGLATAWSSARLAGEMAGRATVQIVEADPTARAAQATAALRAARAIPAVRRVEPVPDARVQALVEPWLGSAGEALPLPALIDVELDEGGADALATALARVAPGARVDAHGRWLEPVNRLVSALAMLAAVLVLLIGAATAAAVVLAARGALDGQRDTVEVLHLLGAGDRQIARLFQRRFAGDALVGGAAGLLAGAAVLLGIARLADALCSGLVGTARPPLAAFASLLLVPLLAAAVATVSARWTVLRALARMQ